MLNGVTHHLHGTIPPQTAANYKADFGAALRRTVTDGAAGGPLFPAAVCGRAFVL